MDLNSDRKGVLIAAILLAFAIIVIKLFVIQILNPEYRLSAENNALKYETRYPARGLIRDREGRILVGNKTTYDIQVTPYYVTEFDTTEFCRIFGIDTSFVNEKFRYYKEYRRKIGYQSMTMLKQVSGEQYNVFMEKSFLFPGFSGTPRTSRTYNFNAGGNLLGYISEVDQAYIDRHPDYRSGDYAGRTGMEEAYESILRGQKGYTIYLRDAHNQIKERYRGGEMDVTAVAGTDVVTTIDAPLQAYGESLMKNKVGSLVAIEPSTGEILTMVSSPGIDVSQLAEINKYYNKIISDPYKPMFNRAVMSPQPPGSCFKVVNGLIGLQEGVVQTTTMYPCHHGFIMGKLKVGCHGHASPLDMYHAIQTSCNSYFCYVFKAIIENKKYGSTREAFNKWKEYTESFGFGVKLGSDIPSEQAGTMPTAERYDKLHGKNRWKALSIISLAIGQGEIGCTPLHLANFCATVANRGYFYTPHIQKDTPECPIDDRFKEKHYTMVDSVYFVELVKGMRMSVTGGTSRIAAVPGVEVCGKTGTAQNPHGADNSVFMCFAPMDNPKIAVAAYIENAGFGATWAAPIASLLVEQYLNGEIAPERRDLEKRMMETSLKERVKVRK